VSTETDADLLGMFSAAEFGTAAVFRAGGVGPGVSVVILFDTPDADAFAFGTPLRAASRKLRVPAAALAGAEPTAGDTFTVGSDVLTVKAARRMPPDGAIWDVET
jgi:hypothetical protein